MVLFQKLCTTLPIGKFRCYKENTEIMGLFLYFFCCGKNLYQPTFSLYLSQVINSTLLCFLHHSPSTLCLEQPLRDDRVFGWGQSRSAGYVAILPSPHLSSWQDDFWLCEILAITMNLFIQIPHPTAALRAWPGASQGAELAEASFFLFLFFQSLFSLVNAAIKNQHKTQVEAK